MAFKKQTPLPASILVFIFSLALSQASIHDACKDAENPDICISSYQALALDSAPPHLIASAAQFTGLARASVAELLLSTRKLGNFLRYSSLRQQAAVRDCKELLYDASALISKSHSALRSHFNDQGVVEDVHTWMSAALTYYTTCVDGLSTSLSGSKSQDFLRRGKKTQELLRSSLASIAMLNPNRKSMKKAPILVSKTIGNNSILPNVTVAQDGSGQFATIGDALAAAPRKSSTRYVIYIKQGTYTESLEIAKIQNLMLIGDGIGKTIITGNKSVQDPNITTFTSATVIVKTDNFIAQDLTFQNTAGAVNHQAVAVRISADKVAFFRCSFEGYQDTLYAHSQRQFFTQCDIYGTVDYIFGNAAAEFQNCNLYARLPMAKQKNTYTAQGRTDPNQNTGFAFQNCNIDGVLELQQNISQFPTYLGRPWKEYSLTVFLKCYQSSVVHPAGWLPWSEDFALATLFYGEYFCYGPGAGIAKRVDWSTQIYNSTFASQYTAAILVSGDEWFPGTSLPFTLVL